MRMVPGTHREQVAHRDTFAPDNLLSRGQEVMVDVDEAKAVDIVLHPGEMSLHHVRMFHGSPPNRSDDRRIGYAIRYISRRASGRSRASGTARRWSAAWTATAISTPSSPRRAISRPRPW